VSLLVMGVVAILASALSLGTVIDALVTTRILVQFIGQTVVLVYLRRTKPDVPRPFRMWLYPWPAVVAIGGWAFVYATSGFELLAFGAALLVAGVVVFEVWSRTRT
jgi:amino acid transporter